MNKRISSRAIIIDDGKLLTFFRRKVKDGKVSEYYSLPGGGVEENETIEEGVTRELNEEMGLTIKILGYLGAIESSDRIEHYFHCVIVKGTPVLGGEELERMTKENYYEVSYIDLADLDNVDIYAKDKINMALKNEYVKKRTRNNKYV